MSIQSRTEIYSPDGSAIIRVGEIGLDNLNRSTYSANLHEWQTYLDAGWKTRKVEVEVEDGPFVTLITE